jgi:hypothetical protein
MAILPLQRRQQQRADPAGTRLPGKLRCKGDRLELARTRPLMSRD